MEISQFYSLFDYYYSKNILKLKKNINLSQRQTEYKQKVIIITKKFR